MKSKESEFCLFLWLVVLKIIRCVKLFKTIFRSEDTIFLGNTHNNISLCLATISDEGLSLETSAVENLYSGQFMLLTELITPNYLVVPSLTQHHSFFRNSSPFSSQVSGVKDMLLR